MYEQFICQVFYFKDLRFDVGLLDYMGCFSFKFMNNKIQYVLNHLINFVYTHS